MVESIKTVLMRRDGITAEEADELIDMAKESLKEHVANNDMDSAYNICQDYFGLEPDYLEELMGVLL